jgi:hypothetical protein
MFYILLIVIILTKFVSEVPYNSEINRWIPCKNMSKSRLFCFSCNEPYAPVKGQGGDNILVDIRKYLFLS